MKKADRRAVAGYVRVSTAAQVKRGLGLEVQRAEIMKFCRDHGWDLTAVYEDRGITGEILDRPGLQDLLAGLDGVQAVMVLNTGRLWRGDVVRGVLKKTLLDAGVEVISIEQPGYSLAQTDPSEYLVNAIMEALDVYQRLEITLKLKRARAKKARNGHKASGVAPLGYRYAGPRKTIEVVLEEAAVVRAAFEAFIATRSVAATKQALDMGGHKTRRGRPFSVQSLRFLLMNDFYTGVVTWRGEKIPGQHEPLVDARTFRRVQRLLGAPKQRHRPVRRASA